MAQGKKQPATGKTPDFPLSVAEKAVDSNKALALVTMRGANPFQRIIVYCCYGLISLGIVILSIPPYETRKQLVSFVLVGVLLFIVALFIAVRYRDLTHKTGGVPDRASVLPQDLGAQISDVVRDRLRTVLSDARRKVYEFLKQKNGTIVDDDVRANIFLPEYNKSGNQDDYTLKICPGLHLKMNHQPELGITFQPGQGATGVVFKSGMPRVTQKLQSGAGDWDTIFDITDELADIIHRDLKWIISLPIKAGNQTPIGVMNVDGLRHQFDVDGLYECMGLVTDSAIIMNGLLR